MGIVITDFGNIKIQNAAQIFEQGTTVRPQKIKPQRYWAANISVNMALRGIKSKEEEDPYMQPLAGVKTVDISGGQVTPVLGDKASLLKSAKTPPAPVATAPVGQNQPETAATTNGPLSWNPSMRSEEEVQRGKDIAGKVRGLAKEGKLTAVLLKKARDRGVTDSAFDDKGFDAFLKKGIGVSENPVAASNLQKRLCFSGAFDAAVARQSGGCRLSSTIWFG